MTGRAVQASLPALIALIALTACAGPSSRQPGGAPTTAEQQSAPTRTLVAITRGEPDSIASKQIFRATGLNYHATALLFNAELTQLDDRGTVHPYLAESLPALNTDSWRVFPDGAMETTYRLQPDLTWQDGTPLTAQDFTFAWTVFSTPTIGVTGSLPISYMDDVQAPDDRTVVIHWKQAYPDAGSVGITDRELPPLPRHLLAVPFDQDQGETFGHSAFWTTDYVGLGPFKLDRWEPGSFLEASAFSGYVLGRPKIDRLRLLFIADFNTALANMLSGEAHIAFDDALRSDETATLKRAWQPTDGGSVIAQPAQWRRSEPQLRPEYASPLAMTDVRVRRAMSHAIDHKALVEALFGADGLAADSFITPQAPYFADLDRAIAKYPYDPRRSEELMGQAGWTKGADGILANPDQGRFTGEIKANASPQSDKETLIVSSDLQAAGFDLQPISVPPAQSRLGEVRATFHTLYSGSGSVGERALLNLPSARIPTAENRWVGANRAGWDSPEFDRLFDAYSSTLDRKVRDGQVIEMVKLYTEDVGAISLAYDLKVIPFVSSLVGPGPYVPDTDVTWNAYQWTWK